MANAVKMKLGCSKQGVHVIATNTTSSPVAKATLVYWMMVAPTKSGSLKLDNALAVGHSAEVGLNAGGGPCAAWYVFSLGIPNKAKGP